MISVCMAAYNGEKFIRQQLLSILKQLNPEDEVIVSDDGSTDKTLEIIQSFNDSRIKILHHKSDKRLLKRSLGNYMVVAQNFENALLHASGDIIVMSDQDDLWDSDRIERIKKDLSSNLLVMVNYQIIDENDIKQGIIGYDSSPIYQNWFLNVLKSRFMCCCLAYRKQLLPYILPFPKDLKSCDQWIGCNASKYGKINFINDVYHLYRRHGKNVSSTSEQSSNSLFIKIIFRLNLLYNLNKNFINKRGI